MEKNKLLIVCLILLSSTVCSQTSHKINCEESFLVMYRDSSSENKLSEKKYIGFEGGFNDTLEVYLNGALLSKGFYKTISSLGSTGVKLTFKSKKNVNNNILLVKNTTQNHCLEFAIDGRYKILYIDFEGGKWGVSYSNRFTIYE